MIPTRNLVGVSAAVALMTGAFGQPVSHAARTGAQTTEQQMYVSVLGKDGVPVVDLSTDEFVVREDGVRREVLRVSKATEPMQIALLVDNSQAVTPFLRDLRHGLESFIDAMAGDNEIALMTFGDRPTIVVDYRRSLLELQQGVRRVFPRPDSGAYLLDTTYDAARGLSRRQAARPVMVLIVAEGIDFSSRYYGRVLSSLETSGAVLHAVVLTAGGALFRADARDRDRVLDEGTKRTGGRHDVLLRGQRLVETLEALAQELRNQYLLVYARPPMLVPPRRIELGVTRESLVARGTPVRAD